MVATFKLARLKEVVPATKSDEWVSRDEPPNASQIKRSNNMDTKNI
jgi:hypothetical protein